LFSNLVRTRLHVQVSILKIKDQSGHKREA